MTIRNTSTTRAVLDSFLDVHGQDLYGLDIMRQTGLASGTIYPILRRLEEQGWLSSRWEDIDPEVEGRPARRLYRINADGVAGARAFSGEVEARKRRSGIAWQRPLPGTEGVG